jgi:hypothetical protein
LDPEVAALLDRSVRRRIERGTLPPRYCSRCGNRLTDPASIRAGIGPDCAAALAAEQTVESAFPVGTEVRITRGVLLEGTVATVIGYKHGRAKSLRLFSRATSAVSVSPDAVELVDEERAA